MRTTPPPLQTVIGRALMTFRQFADRPSRQVVVGADGSQPPAARVMSFKEFVQGQRAQST